MKKYFLHFVRWGYAAPNPTLRATPWVVTIPNSSSVLRILSAVMLSFLAACSASGPSSEQPEFTGVKIGKPYSIAGKWYQPARDDSYSKTGMASWYGPGFHGRKTANGEIFNQHDMTAAHPTLPMPSLVKVTNLNNQRQAIVRINDRGPFHGGRIIDLSKAAAEKLGVIATGVAQVRVEYLPEETQLYIASKGRIFPDVNESKAETEVASTLMPREQVDLSPEQDAKYYPVEVKELDRNDFIPAPTQIANNAGPVVDSAPILSVESRESKRLPAFIKPAYADAAPYASALKTPAEDQYKKELSESKTAPLSGWSVQVASFSERKNADALTQKLLPLGQPELQPVLVDGLEWYRVYLHPLAGAEKETLIAELQKIGLRDARIVN